MFNFIILILISFKSNLFSLENLTLRQLSELFSEITNQSVATNSDFSEKINLYLHKEVCIRGFVYPTQDGHFILASEPNLKSCCVAGKNTIMRQVLVLGDFDEVSVSSNHQVHELQGRFEIEPLKNDDGSWKRLFVLYDAKIIKKESFGNFWIYSFVCGIIFLVSIAFLIRSKK